MAFCGCNWNMEWLVEICKDFGYSGMFLISFLSGTVLPGSSDILMLALLPMGLSPVGLVLSGTLGNTIGGITCYYAGSLLKSRRVAAFFKVSPEKRERAEAYVHKYGYWAAFFSFVAVVGEAVIIVLGSMRVSWWKVFVVMTIGKLLRYAAIALSYEGIEAIFT